MPIHRHLLCSALCFLLGTSPPVSKLANEEVFCSLVGGSWVVMPDRYHNTAQLPQPAIITFAHTHSGMTGFDGCNEFKGEYMVEQALLRGRIRSITAHSCRNATANHIRRTLRALLRDGAQASLVSWRGSHILILQDRDTLDELRLVSVTP